MTIVRVGTNKKYSEGWESAFGKGGKKSAAVATKAKAGKKSTAKKPAKASAKKKQSAKKGKKK